MDEEAAIRERAYYLSLENPHNSPEENWNLARELQRRSQLVTNMSDHEQDRASPEAANGVQEREPFAVGMALEAVDRRNPHLVCAATITEIDHESETPLKIHFDGWSEVYDYWASADSPDLRPIGYCARHGIYLQAPGDVVNFGSGVRFHWTGYLQSVGREAAPIICFVLEDELPPLLGAVQDARGQIVDEDEVQQEDIVLDDLVPELAEDLMPFEPGWKLEAENLETEQLTVATVAAVDADEYPYDVMIHYDGTLDEDDIWLSLRHLFPVGYAHAHGKLLEAPVGYIGLFDWDAYMTATNAVQAPEECFLDHDELRDLAEENYFSDHSLVDDDNPWGPERQGDSLLQYVYKVTNFSSQYGRTSYCADKLVGPPTIYPRYGDFTSACVVRTYGPWWRICPSAAKPIGGSAFATRDFIEIEYQHQVKPKRLDIYETFNVGAVVRVLAQPVMSDRWVVLWEGEPTDEPPASRIFRVPLREYNFYTILLRLEVDSVGLDYYAEIDAVRLIGDVNKEPPQFEEKTISLDAVSKANRVLWETVQRSVSGGQKSFSEESEFELESGDFTVLPDELVCAIIDTLDIRDLLRVACVSKRFFYLSTSTFYRMQELDLQPHFQVVSDSFLHYLSRKLHNISRLSLSWTGSVNSLSVNSERTIQSGVDFFKTCGKSLTVLQLACCSWLTDEVMEIVADTCPLVELDIQRCRNLSPAGFRHLKKFDLLRLNAYHTNCSSETIPMIVEHNRRLEHINFDHCQVHNGTETAHSIAINCPNLISLNVWYWQSLTSPGVVEICRRCRQLKELDIGWSGCNFNEVIQNLGDIGLPPNLEKLFLTASVKVNDDGLRELMRQCKNLRQLDFLNSDISTVAITSLLEECRELEFLDVSFCSGLRVDEVQDLRMTYNHVDIKKSIS